MTDIDEAPVKRGRGRPPKGGDKKSVDASNREYRERLQGEGRTIISVQIPESAKEKFREYVALLNQERGFK